MSVAALMAGTAVEVVGVEDGPDGAIKVYMTHRNMGAYVLIDDPCAQREVRAAWAGGGRVSMPAPPRECVFYDDDSTALDEAPKP